MPALKNQKHEKFCQLVAQGMKDMQAYREVGYKHDNDHAWRMRGRAGVSERIAELEKANRTKLNLTREEALGFLFQSIATPVGQVDENSWLAQSVETTTTYDKNGSPIERKKITMPGKVQAMQQLCRMCGWEAPSKVEHKVELSQALQEINRIRSVKPLASKN